MSGPTPPVLIFRGENGAECEGFIRGVRSWAFQQGKQRDNAWMADYASTCFDGAALRWFEDLDPDIQEDWGNLKKELLKQYPRDGEEYVPQFSNPAIPAAASISPAPYPVAAGLSNLSIADEKHPSMEDSPTTLTEEEEARLARGEKYIPTPAAAPPNYDRGPPATVSTLPPVYTNPTMVAPRFPNQPQPSSQPRRGRIALYIGDGSSAKKRYIRKSMNWSHFFKYTSKVADALIVQYTPGPGLQTLNMMNCASEGYQYLGITWDISSSKTLFPGLGSTQRAEIAGMSGAAPNLSTSSTCSGESRAEIWDIASDGNLLAVWFDGQGTKYVLEPMVMSDWLYVAFDLKAYVASDWATYESMRCMFEPM